MSGQERNLEASVAPLDPEIELQVRKLVEQRLGAFGTLAQKVAAVFVAIMAAVFAAAGWSTATSIKNYAQDEVKASLAESETEVKEEIKRLRSELDSARKELGRLQGEASTVVATAEVHQENAKKLSEEAKREAESAKNQFVSAQELSKAAKLEAQDAEIIAARAKDAAQAAEIASASASRSSTAAAEESKRASQLITDLQSQVENTKSVADFMSNVDNFVGEIVSNEDFQQSVAERILSPQNGKLVLQGDLQVTGKIKAAQLDEMLDKLERVHKSPGGIEIDGKLTVMNTEAGEGNVVIDVSSNGNGGIWIRNKLGQDAITAVTTIPGNGVLRVKDSNGEDAHVLSSSNVR